MTEQSTAAAAYLATLNHLKTVAPEIAHAVIHELQDQRHHLKLIASENYSSLSVQLAMGNLLTDKYSEGYPFHRFYAGCENVDSIEQRAENLGKELFGAEHCYVQPHSGADANLVALWAILNKRVQSSRIEKLGKKSLDALTPEEYEELRQELSNQTLMGLSLHSGGHLTHGYRHNVSAKMFRAITYDVDPKTCLLDYSKIAEIARKEKPLILLAGYSAYPRRINFAKMREIADEVGAVLMVDMAHFAGLVAGNAFKGEENPIAYAHVVTSTTHKTLRGPRGGVVLCTKEFADDVNRGCPNILGGPLPHVMAAKAIAFQEALQPEFRTYVQRILDNANALAAGLMKRGMKVVTDGTDNHLLLIDLSDMPITGRQAELALASVGVTVNRNMVPFDPKGAWYTAGVRVGTPALTTRGLGIDEMDEIADIIVTILNNLKPATIEKTGKPSSARYTIEPKWMEEAKKRVTEILSHYPLYPELTIEE
ncbi:MAG: Serine hydroxymethyltransferase [Chlamydiales bacterium]|nr:Serine hydroxymethyltransferase [Chlamydiales bacterium]MCH9619228.1 Serine hydroxymethyltransferase [Chlamydiales bacterium]MCH9622490.1 Serine hydroxymethyltransferase [Chlamydiales bacterium]